jgi:hypothetical protein
MFDLPNERVIMDITLKNPEKTEKEIPNGTQLQINGLDHRSVHPAINCRAIVCRPDGALPSCRVDNSQGFQPLVANGRNDDQGQINIC